jgi:hypothetical protein
LDHLGAGRDRCRQFSETDPVVMAEFETADSADFAD